MNIGLPGYCNKVYPYPGYCATVLQKSQKFRVRVWGSYRTYKSSGYGYESVAELTEVPGRYKNAVPIPRVFVARAYRPYRNSGYGYECRTELTEVSGTGTGMSALQNLQVFVG